MFLGVFGACCFDSSHTANAVVVQMLEVMEDGKPTWQAQTITDLQMAKKAVPEDITDLTNSATQSMSEVMSSEDEAPLFEEASVDDLRTAFVETYKPTERWRPLDDNVHMGTQTSCQLPDEPPLSPAWNPQVPGSTSISSSDQDLETMDAKIPLALALLCLKRGVTP